MKFNIAIILLFFSINIYSQKNYKFPDYILASPRKYSVQLQKRLNYKEIIVFEDTMKESHVTLTNGYARYKIIDGEKWLKNKKGKIPYKVDIVYTKYPLRKQDWITNYDELLANRLKALFKLDSNLNRKNIEFNTVLQVKCYTDKQTRKMFHGIVIYYKDSASVSKKELAKIKSDAPKGKHYLFDQSRNLPPMLKYIKVDDSVAVSGVVLQKIISQIGMIDEFHDADVMKILDRHPEWKNMVVVMDWTGSMYSYSGQAVLWHALNFERKRIDKFVFFNDGDKKKTNEKILGKTGGIYPFDADNLEDVIEVMYEITQRGKGGDWPENDMEALLYAQNHWKNVKELFLIADNRSYIRDFALIDSIKVPVHVILCGNSIAYNLYYINLAYKTGGTIHTIDEDIEDFKKLKANKQMKALNQIWYLTGKRITGVKPKLYKIVKPNEN